MGEAITRRFVEKGWTVHAVARDASSLQKFADELGVVPHAVDLRDLAALTAAVSGLEVDVLVNCAGVSRQGNILDSTPDDLDSLVDVNLRAVLHLTRILLPGMVERDRGHIINISSIAGIYNFFGHTAYHATKAAVHQLSRQIRNDTVGRRIRVTEICPGRVETEIFGRKSRRYPRGSAAGVGHLLRGVRVADHRRHRRVGRLRRLGPAAHERVDDRDPADVPGAGRSHLRPA